MGDFPVHHLFSTEKILNQFEPCDQTRAFWENKNPSIK
jgi:hypothetical protein